MRKFFAISCNWNDVIYTEEQIINLIISMQVDSTNFEHHIDLILQ